MTKSEGVAEWRAAARIIGVADNRPPRPVPRVRPIPPFTENLIDLVLAGCQNETDISRKKGKKAGRRVIYLLKTVPFPAYCSSFLGAP